MTTPLSVHVSQGLVWLHFEGRATFSVEPSEALKLASALVEAAEELEPRTYPVGEQHADGAEGP